MTTATKNLENDHIHILRLIDIMERITKQDVPDVAHLEEVVYLIRNFADGMHHLKEENLLFPLLGDKGLPREQGPVAVMLHEHEQGRAYVRGMADNIPLYKQGEHAARDTIYRNMLGYAGLLRNHIDKESNILFRMADNLFSDAEQQSLLTEFGKIENPDSGVNHRSFLERIEHLAAVYL